AADGLQMGESLQGRRRRRAEGTQSCSAWLSASNDEEDRRAGRALEEDSRLRRTKASSAASKAGGCCRSSLPQHGLRHLETPRLGEEPATTPEVAASWCGAAAHRCAERGVDDRLQGPVQNARRRVLLPADSAGQL